MARFLKSRKDTIGLSPDAMQFIGEKKANETKLRVLDYDSSELNEYEINSIKESIILDKTKTKTWLNIDGLHDAEIMQQLSLGFDIDSLIISDLLDTTARPKIQEYKNCIFISTKMLQYNETINEISSENLVLIIKENILISFQERVGDMFNPVKERLRNHKKRIRNSGTDYLAFALLDVVIDNYIYVISLLGERIESLDEELIENRSTNHLEKINTYKSEINYLRKAIKPCREMILSLVKMESDFITEGIHIHLKDLQDNINHANDSVDSYRDMLSDQLNIFHTTVSNRLNDILKFLTIFSVIFIPITFIAGIYGTNFDNIPELHYRYSYFIMWGAILVIVISMVLYFKRKKWF